MSKENILLRETVNPPLTTKGSEFLYSDLDGNWIEIFNQFVALSQSSNVPLYSAIIEYSIGEYVSSNLNGALQTWKMINGTPQTNVTPGTDPLTWIPVYATEMVAPPLIGGAKIYTKEVIIPSASILLLPTLFELISAPGSGKYINLLQSVFSLSFNSAPYEAFQTLQIGFSSVLGGGGSGLWELDQGLAAETTQIRRFENVYPTYGPTNIFIRPNDSLSLISVGGAPILGDSDIKINLTYEILDL